MLNSTLCALTRTICCILENNQQRVGPDGRLGVEVPAALVAFMGGITHLPYVRESRPYGKAEKAIVEAVDETDDVAEKLGNVAVSDGGDDDVAGNEIAPGALGRASRRGSTFTVGNQEYATDVPALAGKKFDALEAYLDHLRQQQ